MKKQYRDFTETQQEAAKNKRRANKLAIWVIGATILFYALSFSLSYAAAWLFWANELFKIN